MSRGISTLENEDNKLPRNAGILLPTRAAFTPQKKEILSYTIPKKTQIRI